MAGHRGQPGIREPGMRSIDAEKRPVADFADECVNLRYNA
jgi:hypothetical protein